MKDEIRKGWIVRWLVDILNGETRRYILNGDTFRSKTVLHSTRIENDQENSKVDKFFSEVLHSVNYKPQDEKIKKNYKCILIIEVINFRQVTWLVSFNERVLNSKQFVNFELDQIPKFTGTRLGTDWWISRSEKNGLGTLNQRLISDKVVGIINLHGGPLVLRVH